MTTVQDFAYSGRGLRDYSLAERRYQTAPRAYFRLEKDKQKRLNEILSSTPASKGEKREGDDVFSGSGAGMKISSFKVCSHKLWSADRSADGRRLHYPRPTPTYSNPIARSREASSRFLVSTMIGFLSKCLMRSKSRARNSGQPVPTTSASMPSAAV